MKATNLDYKKIFLGIACEYNTSIFFDKKRYYDAEVQRETFFGDKFLYQSIHLKGIRTSEHFAIALHELGHVILEDFEYLKANHKKILFRFTDTVTKHIIKEEFNAWKKAKEIAPFWNKSMDKVYLTAMTGYVDRWQSNWEVKNKKAILKHVFNLNNCYFNIYHGLLGKKNITHFPEFKLVSH